MTCVGQGTAGQMLHAWVGGFYKVEVVGLALRRPRRTPPLDPGVLELLACQIIRRLRNSIRVFVNSNRCLCWSRIRCLVPLRVRRFTGASVAGFSTPAMAATLRCRMFSAPGTTGMPDAGRFARSSFDDSIRMGVRNLLSIVCPAAPIEPSSAILRATAARQTFGLQSSPDALHANLLRRPYSP